VSSGEPEARWPPGVWGWARLGIFVFHAAAMLALSLPGTGRMRDPAFWRAAHTRSEVARWARFLGALGVETTAADLEETLRDLGGGYAEARRSIVAPFLTYAELAHLRQGWSMFSSPQTHPAEVWIEIDRGDGAGFVPVYVERSPVHRWRHHQLDHNRVRKLMGRLARSTRRRHWRDLARWAAAQLATDFPDAQRARFRLRRWRSPTPAALHRGAWPERRFTDVIVVDLDPVAEGS